MPRKSEIMNIIISIDDAIITIYNGEKEIKYKRVK